MQVQFHIQQLHKRFEVLYVNIIFQFFAAMLPSLIVGIVLACWNRKQNASEKRRETQIADKAELDKLRLDLLVATAQLAYATAMAWKRGAPNGEMEEAMATYERAMRHFRDFERESVTKINSD